LNFSLFSFTRYTSPILDMDLDFFNEDYDSKAAAGYIYLIDASELDEVDSLDYTTWGDFFVGIFLLIVVVLLMIALYTLAERKLMASVQRRQGPVVNGYHGLLQPFADGLKLVIKEGVVPFKADKIIFFFAPIFFLTFSLTIWALLPFSVETVLVDVNYSLLVLYTFSSLSVLGVIFSGWASNSVYSFLGGLRSAAQMISYEVSIGFILVLFTLVTGSFNLLEIATYAEKIPLFFPLLPLFFIWLISALAETNRAPFDLPESESELVAGYNTEYSGIMFALFFLAEYSNMLIMALLTVLFFFSTKLGLVSLYGFGFGFTIVFIFITMVFVLVRATLPRYRYDQLMSIGWTVFLPLLLGLFFFYFGSFLLF